MIAYSFYDIISLLKSELAASSRSIELKIGIDAGVGLCHYASGMPDRFFIGAELKHDKCLIATDMLAQRRLRNAVVVHTEAIHFLDECVSFDGGERFDAIHVNFPTPYPRAISLESILVTEQFSELAYAALKPGGVIRLVTDVCSYFIKASHCFHPDKWSGVPWQPLPVRVRLNERYLVGTPCEIDFRNDGRMIYYMQLMKRM